MKMTWSLLLLFGFVVYFGASNSAVAASSNDKLQVSARVVARQSVIVDSAGNIKTIISNSDQEVQPIFYQNEISTENELAFTKQLHDAYRRHVSPGAVRPGIIHILIPTMLRTADTSIPTGVPGISQNLLFAI